MVAGRPGRPRQTHCKRGHEFTPENTLTRPKGRECRICCNANFKIRYNRDPELRKKHYAAEVRRREDRKATRILTETCDWKGDVLMTVSELIENLKNVDSDLVVHFTQNRPLQYQVWTNPIESVDTYKTPNDDSAPIVLLRGR